MPNFLHFSRRIGVSRLHEVPVGIVILAANMFASSVNAQGPGGCQGGGSNRQMSTGMTSGYDPMQMMVSQYANQMALMQQQAYQRQVAYMQQIARYQAELRLAAQRQQAAEALSKVQQQKEKAEYRKVTKAEKIAAAKAKREQTKLAVSDE